MNVVAFDNVRRAYKRGVPVLDGVSFGIGQGEVVGLLGKNGAGKTTLIRIGMGMIEPQGGAVRIFGEDPRRKPVEVKRRVGYVSEDQVLPPFLSVREVLRLHRDLYPTWDNALATELIDRFRIPVSGKVGKLSKGQARQVALLCAVSHRPEVLILDEPAGGLDPAARREFLETSIRLLNEAGSTILFSSHHMSDVERMAERIVLLHDGRILLDSALDELREAFSVALVAYGPGVDRARVRGLSGCLGVRERSDAMHAVFHLDARAADGLLQRELGAGGVRARSVDLEEMFIELVGGQG